MRVESDVEVHAPPSPLDPKPPSGVVNPVPVEPPSEPADAVPPLEPFDPLELLEPPERLEFAAVDPDPVVGPDSFDLAELPHAKSTQQPMDQRTAGRRKPVSMTQSAEARHSWLKKGGSRREDPAWRVC